MTETSEALVRQNLRSPRSAAIAGILYALMTATSMILIENIVNATPNDINRAWLEIWSPTASIALFLIPLSGIAFLWFTGVIRELIGDREDRFFATIYFGSAIILIAMTYIWAAVLGAIFATAAIAGGRIADDDVFFFGFAVMSSIMIDYILRIAGVYMISIATVWMRAAITPRWLTIITFLVAVGFVFFAGAFREARFIFPAWVFLVSVYILIVNYRRSNPMEQSQAPHAE